MFDFEEEPDFIMLDIDIHGNIVGIQHKNKRIVSYTDKEHNPLDIELIRARYEALGYEVRPLPELDLIRRRLKEGKHPITGIDYEGNEFRE